MAVDWGEVKRAMHRLTFDKIDASESGKITREYLVDFMANLSPYLETDIDTIEVFKDANLDGSNEINFEKYLKIMAAIENKYDEKLKGVFNVFDKDTDGYISEEDFKIYARDLGRETTDEEIKERIARADLDGDGKISFDECKIYFMTLTKGK